MAVYTIPWNTGGGDITVTTSGVSGPVMVTSTPNSGPARSQVLTIETLASPKVTRTIMVTQEAMQQQVVYYDVSPPDMVSHNGAYLDLGIVLDSEMEVTIKGHFPDWGTYYGCYRIFGCYGSDSAYGLMADGDGALAFFYRDEYTTVNSGSTGTGSDEHYDLTLCVGKIGAKGWRDNETNKSYYTFSNRPSFTCQGNAFLYDMNCVDTQDVYTWNEGPLFDGQSYISELIISRIGTELMHLVPKSTLIGSMYVKGFLDTVTNRFLTPATGYFGTSDSGAI